MMGKISYIFIECLKSYGIEWQLELWQITGVNTKETIHYDKKKTFTKCTLYSMNQKLKDTCIELPEYALPEMQSGAFWDTSLRNATVVFSSYFLVMIMFLVITVSLDREYLLHVHWPHCIWMTFPLHSLIYCNNHNVLGRRSWAFFFCGGGGGKKKASTLKYPR